ncbi:MAG TPA: R3H domain-containing nucleic acid-binding protein [Candidatus Saccharimonadales bacterium]|nr:R3H domain-containing nucleic acid-binding protein [Candidatus Saccharimonadales bacterium]
MEKQKELKNLIEEILKHINAQATVIVEEDPEKISIVTIDGNDLSYLIGYRGESLDGLQTIVNLALYRKFGPETKAVVDINGYRKQRQEKVEQIAKSFIDRVRFLGKEVAMPPMNPFERKTVHTFVGTYDDITSESAGEGPYRHVVLKPKK